MSSLSLLDNTMRVYQVVYVHRKQLYRIRLATVLGETETAFRTAGPVVLWPSKTNTFRLLRGARAYCAAKNAARLNPQTMPPSV
jgi:hypothetical protein